MLYVIAGILPPWNDIQMPVGVGKTIIIDQPTNEYSLLGEELSTRVYKTNPYYRLYHGTKFIALAFCSKGIEWLRNFIIGNFYLA